MIEKSCKTCERGGGGCGLSDCHAPDWSHHFASRAALEARIEALEDVARKLAAEATRSINDVIAKAIEARIERDEMRAQVTARDEEIATLSAQAEDWAAQYRALSARLESELGGLRHSLAEVEDELEECRKERDEARAAARVACSDDKQEHERMREVCRERDHLQKRVSALEDQIEHAGCAAAHLGERTYECRIEAPCGLCRLRARAEAAEAEVSRLGSTAFAYRMRAYSAEARVRELEAERDRHEARERRLTALGFEPPGLDAYTCGDALGLRRPDEVEEDPPDLAKTSPI